MSKPYDVSVKDILTRRPATWVPFVSDRTPDRIEISDTDVSRVSAATDKVIRVFDPDPWILQIDFQSGYLADLDSRTHWYNASLFRAEGVPVISLVVLLHRRADSPRWTGQFQQYDRRGKQYLDFQYTVVRAWQQPLQGMLTGPIGLVPLAMLTDEAQSQLPSVVKEIDNRFRSELNAGDAADFWSMTATLTGLRVDQALLASVRRKKRESP